MHIIFAGESHMDALVAVIEGFPANVFIDENRINSDLARRQKGYGRGGRMKIETDRVKVLSGVINGKSIGSPITLMISNKDNRRETWNPEEKTTVPRPGHADMAGAHKYGFDDIRLVAERASARQTAAWVAAGSVFAAFLEEFGIKIIGYTESIGMIKAKEIIDPFAASGMIESSLFRTGDLSSQEEMINLIDRTRDKGDTLGGIIKVAVCGVPPGLGSYVHPGRKLDSAIAAALMDIPSVKGVEIGSGFRGAARFGSEYHDPIEFRDGKICRKTNNAGGIEGGMSNGETIIVRAAVKPIPTLREPLPSIDINDKHSAPASVIRSDVTAVPAIAVLGEAVTARVICEAFLERFGSDHHKQISERFRNEHF
ncbi:MAG: chorismate synthase [Firmicutes bacterium]|nr:chorismate synthase [Bacillota bacterium]